MSHYQDFLLDKFIATGPSYLPDLTDHVIMLPAGLRCLCAPLVLGVDCYDDSVISARYEARILFATRAALPCSAALLRSTFIVRAGHVLQ